MGKMGELVGWLVEKKKKKKDIGAERWLGSDWIGLQSPALVVRVDSQLSCVVQRWW